MLVCVCERERISLYDCVFMFLYLIINFVCASVCVFENISLFDCFFLCLSINFVCASVCVCVRVCLRV